MGRYWDSWVEQIIEERESSNPTERRRGFVRQLVTELVVYAAVGSTFVLLGFVFDSLTPLVVFTHPYYEAPILIAGTTAVLFRSVWDNWLRELDEPSVNEGDQNESDRELAPDQTTLDDET